MGNSLNSGEFSYSWPASTRSADLDTIPPPFPGRFIALAWELQFRSEARLGSPGNPSLALRVSEIGGHEDQERMETSLHRELKEFYCDDAASREVSVRGYRIDAIVDGTLIEIQQASLAALRKKTKELLRAHSVTIVKPLCALKTIVRLKRKAGPVAWKRTSPRHETIYDVFDELVHFVDVFPHPRLTLEVLLTEQEETRIPKRKRWFRAKDFTVADRRLIAVRSRHIFRTNADLCQLLPAGLADTFTTADIAREAAIPRWLAQKMAYCLRRTEAVVIAGKRRNAVVYTLASNDRAAA